MRYCRISATSLAALAVTALSAHAQTTPVEPTDAAQPTAPTQPAAPAQPTPPAQPAAAVSAAPAEKTTKLERVEITGSSIKRIASETALPVQVITSEQIKRSGATTVADVIQKLPAMQGFQVADIAIGSNSGGIATASLHDIGTSYTLVLLNGRRIAPTGSGSTINLNAIPMSAIERIEVLTDGASALYGADAIAGVVNFVLKKSQQGGSMDVQANVPLEGGGRSTNASVTYGFGELEKDRFSVVTTFRHDEQKQLKSGDRDFAKTAYVPVEQGGKSYIYDRTSTSASPANATVTFQKLGAETTTLPSYGFNPYQKKNGACAANNVYSLANAVTASSTTEYCAFDFVSTIDIFPESTRDAMFVSGRLKATDALTLFSDVAYSRLDLIARIAPNPVPIAIPTNSSYFTTYIKPYLTPEQLAHVKSVSAGYRAVDFGTRDSRTVTDSKHLVLGGEAEIGTWSLNSAFTWSQNAIDERYVGGYFKTAEFNDMISKGSIDPFVASGNQSAATQQLIANSIFNGTVRTASTTLTGVDMRASSDLFTLPAGTVSLGVGGDLRNYHYKQTPDQRAVNGEIYNYAAVPQYDLERKNAGLFAEMLIPVVKDLDLTAAARYDAISAIKDAVAGTTVGSRMNAPTAKLSARFQASPLLLFRGSYGIGFKAPDMLDIAQPLVSNGVTAASYDCPFPGTDACKPGKTQYSQLSGGNAQLRPEKSRQATLGIRLEPTAEFGVGADYWQVEIRDAVSAVSADQAFADPAKYSTLFTTYKTPAETQPFWAFISSSTNIGQTLTRGIDWDVISRFQTEFGRLTVGVNGTYLIESTYSRAGTDSEFTDSMGRYGENAAVSFRNIARATATLDTGDFSNTLLVKARSGYNDKKQTVRDLSTGKNTQITLAVPHYVTVDWQGKYKYSKALELRAGIKNIFNSEPPLTLRDSSGHQVGYDPRYADPFLRTLQLAATYNF